MSKYFKISLIIAVTALALQLIDFDRVDAQYSRIGGENDTQCDECRHISILVALKAMNVRLVRMETSKLRSLKAVQESLLNQIMALRTSFEQIQATEEMSKAEMLASVERVKKNVLDIESLIKNEVMLAFDKQNQEEKNFQARFSPLLVQFEERLNDQNQILDNTHALLKADLIPALKNENEKMRQIIVAEIAKLRG
jgi:anion-transporting  ArsA/GET3 family ATPase